MSDAEGKNMKTFVLGVMGPGPTCSSRWAAQRLLLPFLVKVLGHRTGTLRTIGRKGNPQPEGAEPVLLGKILENLDELSKGRARGRFLAPQLRLHWAGPRGTMTL